MLHYLNLFSLLGELLAIQKKWCLHNLSSWVRLQAVEEKAWDIEQIFWSLPSWKFQMLREHYFTYDFNQIVYYTPTRTVVGILEYSCPSVRP